MTLYNYLDRYVLLPLGDLVYGSCVVKKYKELLRNDIVHHAAVFRRIGAEALHDQSEEREQPYDADDHQEYISKEIAYGSFPRHGSSRRAAPSQSRCLLGSIVSHSVAL